MSTDHKNQNLSTRLEPFVVGGLSAMLASSCIHPIDLTKVRLQLFSTLNPGVKKPSAFTILSEMAKKEGFLSLYTGLSASLMRQAVYGTARIGLHRSISQELQSRNGGEPLSFGLKAISGMTSGSIAVCIGTPFDVTLVRMQADSMKPPELRRGYKNVFDALARVAREEGYTKLYSGLVPNVLRGMSMNVGMLACYDQAQETIGHEIFHEPLSKPPTLETQLLSSLVAGFTASFFSLPFDMLKSRLQDGSKYRGVVQAFFKILKTEGILSFWTGFGAYYMRTAPHSMIILMSQHPIKNMYKQATGSN